MRDLAVGLRPSVLDLGLAPALQWQARHFTKRTGIRVNLQLEGSFEGVPEQQELYLSRGPGDADELCAAFGSQKHRRIAVRLGERDQCKGATTGTASARAPAARMDWD